MISPLVKSDHKVIVIRFLIVTLCFVFFNGHPSHSQEIPEKPFPARLVNDFASILSPPQKEAMEQELADFSKSTSTQILVVTVTTLNGYDKAEFTYAIGEKWGVGQKGFDNGVVIMVKPKEIDGKGEAFIAIAYGLEGVIPDAISKRIVENEMIPYFKQKDYYSGIEAAVKTVMELASGEFTAEDYSNKSSARDGLDSFILFFLIACIFIFVPLFGLISKSKRYAIGHNISLWAALLLLMQQNRSHSGQYSNFRSACGGFGWGGSSGSSAGSGGFGGFGGGSFGGGGAGGSW